jgi:hypothetical protein
MRGRSFTSGLFFSIRYLLTTIHSYGVTGFGAFFGVLK